MSLNQSIEAAVVKKTALLDQDFPRFAVRSILAGAYLTLGTAFAGIVGNAVESLAPGLGAITFAMLFGLGLYSIIILGAELATGLMMFMTYGASNKYVSWGTAFRSIVICTLFNLVGAALIGFMLSFSARFAGLDAANLFTTLTSVKLNKNVLQLLVESVLANFVVNMGVVGAMFAKDFAGKFLTILSMIAIFVGLGLEHVIANFSLFSITAFSVDPLPANKTVAAVSINWVFVWVGNIIGGGFLIGGVYAWLNRGTEAYRD